MFIEEEGVHRGKGGLNHSSHVPCSQVLLVASGHRKGTLGPHRQVVHREGCVVVDLEEAVCKLPESAGSVLVRAVDVRAINEGSQAIELLPGTGSRLSAY